MQQQYFLDLKWKIGFLGSCTSVCLCCPLFTIPKSYVDNTPEVKYTYVEISKCSCKFLALVWNRCCLSKLPSSSKALFLHEQHLHSSHAMNTEACFQSSMVPCVPYLEGMLPFSVITIEWIGTHLTCFGWATIRRAHYSCMGVSPISMLKSWTNIVK